MEWWQYIHSDPKTLNGKPVIKGTRLSVEFLVELMANGWSQQEILDNYPQLTAEHLRAVFLFFAENLREETIFTIPDVA